MNQIFDIEADRANQKLFFLPDGLLSVRSAAVQYAIFGIIALVGGWLLGRVWLICAAALVLTVLYSAPYLRFKDRPFSGLLANAIGHGTLVYYFGRLIVAPEQLPAAGESVGYALAVAGVYLLTTIPDRRGDAKAGKRTMSVWLGPARTAVVAVLCVLGAVIAAGIHHQWPLAISTALSWPWFMLTILSERFSAPAIRVALLTLTFFACLAFWPYFLVLGGLYVSTRWYYRRRFGIAYPRMSAGE